MEALGRLQDAIFYFIDPDRCFGKRLSCSELTVAGNATAQPTHTKQKEDIRDFVGLNTVRSTSLIFPAAQAGWPDNGFMADQPQFLTPNGHHRDQAPAQPWERLPAESNPAFDAFDAYRSMGSTRSCTKVGQQLGKSTTLMDRWCQRHRWVERAAEWDLSLAKIPSGLSFQ
jgi:hypothetical protein